MDKAQKEKLRQALTTAGIQTLLMDRFIDSFALSCDESCYYGCSKCCSSGTANRAFAELQTAAR